MTEYSESYIGRLRSIVGPQLLLVPGARIVIENETGKVLLQKRSDFQMWGLPGGNAEEGEGLEVVIAREVAEETGLQVRNLRPFGFGCDRKSRLLRSQTAIVASSSYSTFSLSRTWGLQE